ncbi:hypothetical protein ACTHQC_07315 [Bacillus paralicheniformis]|uniref:hypothetical protein n=1 Tax=Bacillus paralicheniformis TaxID=1648923 RepID=UPI003F7B7678
MAILISAERNALNKIIDFTIEFHDENFDEKSKVVMLRIREALKDEGVEMNGEAFDILFKIEKGAKRMRQITDHHAKKIREANKVENSDGYKKIIEEIECTARSGLYGMVYDFYELDLRCYQEIEKALVSQGYKCSIRESAVIGKLEIEVSWEPENGGVERC